jgi:two-component system, LytTR family, sensor kinase
MKEQTGPPSKTQERSLGRIRPVLMHPVVFIGIWASLGVLFALQEWMNLRRWGYHIGLQVELRSWGVEYLIWGILSWLLWRTLGDFIQKAGLKTALIRVVPLSFAVCVVKQMIFVLLFPDLPVNRPHMPYWTRLQFHLDAEIVSDMVVFWSSFLLIRGLGYYQRSRESERVAAQLETQLANARLSALQMQLNPHFLFNAMNSISSLMRTDVDAADEMLEQLSSLLRISLERGSVQMISVRDEIDFVEVYVSMQDRRYGDRVKRSLSVDPELHDAIIPAMVLQPIVENAYVHGLSKIERDGDLTLEVRKAGDQIAMTVINSGVGLMHGAGVSCGHGVGISNLRSRLSLHYGANCSFEMTELDSSHVQVRIELPIQYSDAENLQGARYGAA